MRATHGYVRRRTGAGRGSWPAGIGRAALIHRSDALVASVLIIAATLIAVYDLVLLLVMSSR